MADSANLATKESIYDMMRTTKHKRGQLDNNLRNFWNISFLHMVIVSSSVGSNLVRFGGSFGFLRFGRFKFRFLGPN